MKTQTLLIMISILSLILSINSLSLFLDGKNEIQEAEQDRIDWEENCNGRIKLDDGILTINWEKMAKCG